jgi:DNA-directed RNA polymerase I subunit RPA1
MRRDDAKMVAAKLTRVRVADIVEKIEVCTVPFYNCNGHVSTLYKLQMKLYPEDQLESGLTVDECQATLRTVFVDAMEHAIEKHLDLLHKINEIRAVKVKDIDGSLSDGGEESESRHADGGDTGTSDDDDQNDNDDDLGTDAEKMKRQEKDEMEYDDDTENEEGMGSESEESDEDTAESGGDSQEADKEHKISKETTSVDDLSYSAKKGKKSKDNHGTAKLEEKNQNKGRLDDQKQDQITKRRKKLKRTIHVESNDLDFEIHYAFLDEPHILLAQVTSELEL